MTTVSYKKFAKYLEGKSLEQTLHQARQESLERILANEKEIDMLVDVSKKAPSKKAKAK